MCRSPIQDPLLNPEQPHNGEHGGEQEDAFPLHPGFAMVAEIGYRDYHQLCVGEIEVSDPAHSHEDWLEPHISSLLHLMFKPLLVFYTERYVGQTDVLRCVHVYFLLHDYDVSRDEVCRLRFAHGFRWWEDELGNGNAHFHPQEMISLFPPTWSGGRDGCDAAELEQFRV